MHISNPPRLRPGIEHSALALSKAFRRYPKAWFAFRLFSMFPTNCCEFASLLLAWFLHEEHQCTNLQLVTGELKEDSAHRHVWLSLEGQNIDITADQFDAGLPALLVTRTGGWHSRYSVISVESFDIGFYEHYHNDVREDIVDDYRAIAHLARESSSGNW